MGLNKLSVSFRLAEKKDVRNVGVIAHNNRKFFAKNVDQSRSENNISFKQIELKKFYHELFDDALKNYNEHQRSNRKITDYYEHIKNSKQENLFEEIIVEFGNMNDCPIGSDDWNLKAQLAKEYMDEFEKRNPNMKVFNAVLHLDEASPHLHIDFVPIATNQTRGLSTRVSLTQALIEQGFIPQGRMENGRAMWGNSEREYMTELLHRHNLERDNKNMHRGHLSIAEFKAQCAEAEKLKQQLEIMSAKGQAEYSPEEVALITNQNELMKRELAKLTQENRAKLARFDVFDADKLLYLARELERNNVHFYEENSALFVPETALPLCKKISANYKGFSAGIKDKIRMDIDVLVLSSDNFEQFLAKLHALGYEIKRGKYLAVKSPNAERFTRLKSLGEEYTPEKLTERIARRDEFPSDVRYKIENTPSRIEYEFSIEVSKVISSVQGLAYRPKKARPQKVYSFENDSIIHDLSAQIVTIMDYKIQSAEQLYSVADRLKSELDEIEQKIRANSAEHTQLKAKLANGTADVLTRQRCELLPKQIESLKADREKKRREVARVADVVRYHEKISAGDYVGGIVREQQTMGLKSKSQSPVNENKTENLSKKQGGLKK